MYTINANILSLKNPQNAARTPPTGRGEASPSASRAKVGHSVTVALTGGQQARSLAYISCSCMPIEAECPNDLMN